MLIPKLKKIQAEFKWWFLTFAAIAIIDEIAEKISSEDF